MIEGKQGVRLSATEVGLQIHHWRTGIISHQTADGTCEQVSQAFGQVRAIEELHGIAVCIAGHTYGLIHCHLP